MTNTIKNTNNTTNIIMLTRKCFKITNTNKYKQIQTIQTNRMYSLVFLSARALSNRDKSILCGFRDQYPEIYNIILEIDGIRDKMENVFDCIEELYYNQIRNRYPQQKEGIVCVPLLKCCLMNQSIWVVPTGPLTMEIMPMAK